MSSRKTYFGIGWTGKNPNTATEKSQDGDDRSDYSAPTVVDDEKVAEGLKQLRAWYQPDEGAADGRVSVVDDPSEPTKLGMPYPRPTAVGRSESMPMENTRPAVPDPMRGTMFGHDVHRPEIEEALRERSQWSLVPVVPPTQVTYEPDMAPQSPAAADEAQFSSMGSHAEPLRRHAIPVRTPEAETDAISVRRGSSGRLAIVGVLAACCAVVAFAWYQVRGGGEEATTPSPPAPARPAVAAPAPTLPATTAPAPVHSVPTPAGRAAPDTTRAAAAAAPAAAVVRTPRVADKPAAAVETDNTDRAATTPTTTASAPRSRRSSERRAAAQAAAATEVEGQPIVEEKPKPVERRREAPAPRVEDDDATLPPSLE